MNTNSWERFPNCLLDLGVRLRFPAKTRDGQPVELDDIRVHARSAGSDDVYFEISRHAGTTAAQVHAQEKQRIEGVYSERSVGELSETTFAKGAAFEYRIQWPEAERAVMLVERRGWVYRVLYNPRSELNRDIVSTIRFV
jgi:hypothetical protein